MKSPARPWRHDMSAVARANTLFRLTLAWGVAVFLLSGCSRETTTASNPVVTQNASRDYGYVLGDLIPLSVSIKLPDGESLDNASLPAVGPINEWLSLRSHHVETLSDGDQRTAQLQLVYQVFRGTRTPELATVPPLTLRTTGPAPQVFETPPWSFTLTPVIPPEVADDDLEVRPTLPVEPASTTKAVNRLLLWLTGTLLIVLLWVIREFLRRRRARPFALAAKKVHSMLANSQDADTLREAARILHRALDQTFGETLFAREIDRFCASHPSFSPLRDRLASFFVQSQDLFFDPGASQSHDPGTRDWLKDLARRCVTAENKAL